ncbi:MAG: hypothetical protein IPJ48_16535 [Propionivibrio sp.]|uniref:Uncharacterized protein n=1 Tax=Candidatus Propionivibrio dominans TaxID=2954373 RepID=A0A9D7F9J1_9RHOO|nr:hypothetical protein [Candidatus Propionivibrio dominans]
MQVYRFPEVLAGMLGLPVLVPRSWVLKLRQRVLQHHTEDLNTLTWLLSGPLQETLIFTGSLLRNFPLLRKQPEECSRLVQARRYCASAQAYLERGYCPELAQHRFLFLHQHLVFPKRLD